MVVYNCDRNCSFDHDQTKEHLMFHISNNIPTKIDFSQMNIIPTRNDLLDNKMVSVFNDKVNNHQPVIFMPSSVSESVIFKDYLIYLFGVLPCGSKTCIILKDVDVYFDVLIPTKYDEQEFIAAFRNVYIKEIPYIKIEVVEQYKLHGFQKNKSKYLRIYFSNMKNRRDALKTVTERNILETANDDSNYFNLVARQYRFSTANWNRVSNYQLLNSSNSNIYTHCKYTLLVSANNFKKISKAQYAAYEEKSHLLSQVINKDPTIVGSWDIETHNSTGLIPKVGEDYSLFMMCTAYFYHHSNKPLITFCAVDKWTSKREGISLVVECGDEKNVLIAHAIMLGYMKPELLISFNGGNFDWVMYKDKITRHGLISTFIKNIELIPGHLNANNLTWVFKRETIKIDAENNHDLQCVATYPGTVDVDILPVFLSLYPRAEVKKLASLNFFLAKNNLSSKEDMPYKQMFRYYENADKSSESMANMAEVAYYCVVDCIRPQELFVKRSIIADRRELSILSFVSLADSFYRANGMKVTNVIGAYCHKRGIALSNRNNNDTIRDHYPGAWVYPPVRGLHSDGFVEVDDYDNPGQTKKIRSRPTTGLDFASLYPSLMMAYNLSPDMIVYSKEEADALRNEGYSIHHIEPFTYERGITKGAVSNQKLVKEGWTVRHNGIIAKDDVKTISDFEKIDGKYKPIYKGRDGLPGEKMGIFSFIVKKIFDKRVPIKAEFVKLSTKKEELDLLTEKDEDEYNNIVFNMNKMESKQKALKILANTFYGKSGDFRSSLYEILVAAGITCAGQKNIKMIAEYVKSQGYYVLYGDTDSLYIMCPERLFIDCDREYFDKLANGYDKIKARLEWWEQQVKITMNDMKILKNKVNEYLMKDNGTLFLNMAYEEVGFPTVLCGKKKYFMTPHIENINFYPKDVMIKGIDIIKQGQSLITKQLGEEFIREALSPENTRSLVEIAEDKIRKFYQSEKDPKLFTLNGKYKPEKNNVAIQKFVSRMRDMKERTGDDMYNPPEAGDKFNYIMIVRPQNYTLSGKIIPESKGDIMEYLHVYEQSQLTDNKMEINTTYYMEKNIIGIFARFISPEFKPDIKIDDYDQLDAYCMNKATKHLTELCKQIDKKEPARDVGLRYRNSYKQANKIIKQNFTARYGSMDIVFDFIGETKMASEIMKKIDEYVESIAHERKPNFIKKLLKDGVDLGKIHYIYQSDRGIKNMTRLVCNSKEKSIRNNMFSLVSENIMIFNRYEQRFISVIDIARRDINMLDDKELDKLNTFTDDEYNKIKSLQNMIYNLISLKFIRKDMEYIIEDINAELLKKGINMNID